MKRFPVGFSGASVSFSFMFSRKKYFVKYNYSFFQTKFLAMRIFGSFRLDCGRYQEWSRNFIVDMFQPQKSLFDIELKRLWPTGFKSKCKATFQKLNLRALCSSYFRSKGTLVHKVFNKYMIVKKCQW